MYMLFSMKNNVIAIGAELKDLRKQTLHEMDTIHILKAESAYLTSPVRLKKLNKSYLKLEDTKVTQTISDPRKERVILKSSNFVNKSISRSSVKWRYKKGPVKYLTFASLKK